MSQFFSDFLKNGLNEAQQTAVNHENGPILVVAGAGSGKTRVITARITHLITNKNILPSSIVALTFTNKSATEMKERIASFLGEHANLPFVGTFHAYCVQLLKKHQEHLHNPFFSILDSDDQQKMLQGILHRNNIQKQFTAKSTAYQISQMKNHTVDPAQPATEYLAHPVLTDIFNAYEAEKRASKCLDFDDLLLETLRLFKTNSVIKNRFQEKIRHILVDEYQDTNVVQHELLKAMGLKDDQLAIDSVCAVGDEDQSIYSWRGATVTNMANFKTVFPDTKIITIEQNYRSVQQILTIANHTISNNTQRTPKTLWSEKKGSNRVTEVLCLTEYQEARAITQLLLVAKEKYGLNNVGILYRTHTQSRAIEEALLKDSIPYRIIGGIQFYERKEIKDLIAYLKIIANPFDRTSFFRVINVPARGLGDKFETAFYNDWNDEPFATWQNIIQGYITTEITGKVKTESLKKFMYITHDIEPTHSTSSALETIIERTNYLHYLKDNDEPQEAQARIDNVQELLEAVKHFEANGVKTIATFLDEVALMQDKMSKQNRDAHAVSLMTLHAAKGLEFSLVILPGVEEGIMPTMRSLTNNTAIEEERRLFYVGITRAKEHLVITHAKHRYAYGQMVDQCSSRFLHEIPRDLIPLEDCSYWSVTQLHNFFSNWFGGNVKKASDVYIPSFAQGEVYPELVEGAGKPSKPLPKPSLIISQPILPTGSTGTNWKKNQPIKHEKYGIGTIQEIEEKGSGDTCLTIRFKTSVKKILAQYVRRL